MKKAFREPVRMRKKVALVVDGANDMELFNIADLKVALTPQRFIVERASSVSK